MRKSTGVRPFPRPPLPSPLPSPLPPHLCPSLATGASVVLIETLEDEDDPDHDVNAAPYEAHPAFLTLWYHRTSLSYDSIRCKISARIRSGEAHRTA